jgi:hypothetical protein
MGLFGAYKTRFRSQSACMLEYKRSMRLFKHRRSMKGVPVRIAMAHRRRWLKNAHKREATGLHWRPRKISLALWRVFNWSVRTGKHTGTGFLF